MMAMKTQVIVDLADKSATKLVWHMSKPRSQIFITNSLANSSLIVPVVFIGLAIPSTPKSRIELKFRK